MFGWKDENLGNRRPNFLFFFFEELAYFVGKEERKKMELRKSLENSGRFSESFFFLSFG